MISKTFAALAALSIGAAVPAAAQAPAAPAAVQVGESTDEGDALVGGPGMYIIGAVVLGLIIWGIIELTDNESDFPTSP